MAQERLKIGQRVRTTRDSGSADWRPGSRDGVQWSALGRVVDVHDSHGDVCDVVHDDGTQAPYEDCELELVEITCWHCGKVVSSDQTMCWSSRGPRCMEHEGTPAPEPEPDLIVDTCPRCRAHDDPKDSASSGPFIDNLGDGEHVICLRCGLCWQPFGEHAWPCKVCMGDDDTTKVPVDTLLLLARTMRERIGELKAQSASFEKRWREAGSRAWRECGRRQQLEHDLRELIGRPMIDASVDSLKWWLVKFLEGGALGPGHELDAPVLRDSDEGDREVLRVWLNHQTGRALFAADCRLGLYDDVCDPRDWGKMLHDVAKHVADWYATLPAEDLVHFECKSVIADIERGFDEEKTH